MNMRFITKAAIGALASTTALLATGSAYAQSSYSESGSFSNEGSGSYTVGVLQFNTALGTLQSATLELSTTTALTYSVYNFGSQPYAFTNGTATVETAITGPDSTGVNSVASLVTPVSGTAAVGLNTYPGEDGASGLSSSSITDLADYEGNGTTDEDISVTIDGAQASGQSTNGSAYLFYSATGTASGTVTVTYNYSPASAAPEPGSVALVASGLLGVGGMVVRRRRKA